MTLPLVSVIIPTMRGREMFLEKAVDMFNSQSYPNKEILIDGDAGTIGAKRNRLCARAQGEIVICMDDDDRYHSEWITYSVKFLMENNLAITGLKKLYFYDEDHHELFIYEYPDYATQWVSGATLCFAKAFWEKCNFPDIQIGEDAQFCAGRWNGSEVVIPTLLPHNYIAGFCASIHVDNTSKRRTNTGLWQRQSLSEADRIKHLFGI
jgi:Glycosyl transferase family 2